MPLFLSSVLPADEVHEWGTFTTVSGSDGKILSGLHVEEELLPPFVYSHAGLKYHASMYPHYIRHMIAAGQQGMIFKGMPNNLDLRHVTVKMETPVLYFYGDVRKKYNVKVRFNGGTISQWYPQRKSGDSLPKVTIGAFVMDPNSRPVMDFSEPFEGAIEWDLESIPRSEADEALTFKPSQNLAWEYARVPDANLIKVGDEYENYLFYRGIGNVAQPVKFSVDHEETLVVENQSKEKVPFAFAFENIGGKIRYRSFPSGVEPGHTVRVRESEWKLGESKSWRTEVFRHVRNGLVEQGLTQDESNSMVKTWWKSYFEHEGLRVFWVVPQQELDKVLPIEISPKPEKLVRVMVGRSDILRPRYEQMLVNTLRSGNLKNKSTHRFFEPFVERLRTLVEVPYYGELREDLLLSSVLLSEQFDREGKVIKGKGMSLRFEKREGKRQLNGSGEEWQIVASDTLKIGDINYRWVKDKNILRQQTEDEDGRYRVIHLPLLLAE